MDEALGGLIQISNVIGRNRTLTQGGGGNTSVKTADGKYIYIKASGTTLKDMNLKKGWCKLQLASVLEILKDKEVSRLDFVERENLIVKLLNDSCLDRSESSARPSIEAHMHAIFDSYTAHLHPLVVGPYVCSKNGKAVLERLFSRENLPHLWVPCDSSGYMLARKVARFSAAYKKNYGKMPSIVFLQKHGLTLTAHTPKALLQLVNKVVRTCKSNLRPQKKARLKSPNKSEVLAVERSIKKAMADTIEARVIVKFFFDKDIADFLATPGAKKLSQLPALLPQELAYANGPAMWLENGDYKTVFVKLKQRISHKGKIPAGFLIKKTGLFVVGNKKSIPVIKDMITTSLFTRRWAKKFGGVNPMNQRQRKFVETIYPFKAIW